MNKIYGLVAAVVMFFALLSAAPAYAGNPNVTCQTGVAITDTSGRLHVTVPAGVSCVLRGANVFSLKNEKGAKDVYVYDTTVKHNIHLRDVTRNVVIGTEGCKYDPPVGNNVQVTDSHNVLICFTHADNNIKVMRNDGKITVSHSQADHANIMVQNNLAYRPLPGDNTGHKRPGWIRVFGCTAKEHITIKNNHGRHVHAWANTPVANS